MKSLAGIRTGVAAFVLLLWSGPGAADEPRPKRTKPDGDQSVADCKCSSSAESEVPPQRTQCETHSVDTALLYEGLLAEGVMWLEVGNLDRAIDYLSFAHRFALPEVPHYEELVHLSRAQCLRGDFEEGIRTIRDVECMMDIDFGRKRCFVETKDASRQPTRSPDLTDACFLTMCNELYLPYYEQPEEPSNPQAQRLLKNLAKSRSACRLAE